MENWLSSRSESTGWSEARRMLPGFLGVMGVMGLGLVLQGVAAADEVAQHSAPPPITGSRAVPVPSWGKPLPYPVVIADRRNNRLIEVAPDKRILWQFGSPNLKIYHDNDDVYFSPDGSLLAISEEDNQDIHLIDYAKRELVWSYGVADVPGSAPGYMNFPDDTHVLKDGTIAVADIRNCRVLFIDRATSTILKQWGQPGPKGQAWSRNPGCHHEPPHFFGLPNGVVELDNGHILVTEITGSWVSELTREGRLVWDLHAFGMRYPSDAMPTHDGQVIVADYSRPGRVMIFDPKQRKVTWDYAVKQGEGMLDHPSLAQEMPNGDVILNDDYRHRVIVIDRQTKQIIWQYGQTDQRGNGPGQLNNPDGIDLDLYRDWRAAAR